METHDPPQFLASMRMWANGAWLSPSDWAFRHRVVVLTLWVHAPLLVGLAWFGGQDRIFTMATFEGNSFGHSLLEGSVPAALAALASVPQLSRRVRSLLATLGLVACSAILTHVSGGFIEAHFHFFVMVGLAALYVDWVPFVACLLFVAVHHGIVGTVDPESVFNHPIAIAHPWRWAVLHSVFILGMAATQVANMVLVGKRLEEEKKKADLQARADELL